MAVVYSVTKARACFSQVINRVIYNKENFIITKRGKKVAVIIPFEEFEHGVDRELIEATSYVQGIEEGMVGP